MTNANNRLILASASPRRRMMLRWLDLPFETWTADIDERPLVDETPAELAARLARGKVRATADTHPQAWILGADTVVAYEGETLGKPANPKEAQTMLKTLRDMRHRVFTAVALYHPSHRETYTRRVETEVCMRDYAAAEITAYVASGDPLDKAGAYAIQNADFHPVRRLDRCYANVVGLPLCATWALLRSTPWSFSRDLPALCYKAFGYRCPTTDPGSEI